MTSWSLSCLNGGELRSRGDSPGAWAVSVRLPVPSPARRAPPAAEEAAPPPQPCRSPAPLGAGNGCEVQHSLGGCHGTEGGRWRQPRYDTRVWGTRPAAADRDEDRVRVRDRPCWVCSGPSAPRAPGLFTTFSWETGTRRGAQQRAAGSLLSSARGGDGAGPPADTGGACVTHSRAPTGSCPRGNGLRHGGPQAGGEGKHGCLSQPGSDDCPQPARRAAPGRHGPQRRGQGTEGRRAIPEGQTGRRAAPAEKSERPAGGAGGPRAVPGSDRARDVGKKGHRGHCRDGFGEPSPASRLPSSPRDPATHCRPWSH